MTLINYTAPPTVASFMKSGARVRIIAGPVGSGKTTGCLFEILRRACEQKPASDGYRYTRFAIVRQTLQQLKMTVLKDIEAWLKGIVRFKVSENTIYVEFGDVKSEWLLIPLEDPEDQRRLLSSQLTGAWMSECIEIDTGLVGPLLGRCGRYPNGMTGNPTWRGVIGDTNMPSKMSEWHRLMELERPATWAVFVQPGGLHPDAENLEWLLQTDETLALPIGDPDRRAQGRTYYEDLLHGHSQDWIRRYVNAEYGDDPSGSAVFGDSFNYDFHTVDELEPVQAHALLLGQDFGRDPWSMIGQVDHMGRLRILEEAPASDTGLENHIQKTLRAILMQERYLGLPIAIVGDPSGRNKSSIYEETTFDVLKRMGFTAFPAPTNDIDPRLRAVEAFLLAQRGGGPAIVFDRKRCPTIIRAMGGGYRYAKTRGGQRKLVPQKNEYSHPADALQYLCLAAHGGMTELMSRHLMRPARTSVPSFSSAAWT